jgi:ABC-type branched-subunit amino acid transport system substrate-binding protein
MTDFSAILTRVRGANLDVLAAGTVFEDALPITRQLGEMNVNPKMFGVTVGVDHPRFFKILGRGAEFVYGASQWEAELVTLRAGGLIPIARQYPGAREFVESHRKEFPGAELSYHSAAGYGGCQVLIEAIRRAGSLDGEKVRAAILKLDLNTVFGASYKKEFPGADLCIFAAGGYGGCQTLVEAIRRTGSLNSGKLRDATLKMNHNTVFGAFRVDQDGLQIGRKYVVFQWQDGKRVIVWPEELAPGTPRFPTPPWSQRP